MLPVDLFQPLFHDAPDAAGFAAFLANSSESAWRVLL